MQISSERSSHGRWAGVSTVQFRRLPRLVAPKMPGGEVHLEPPPEVPRMIPGNMMQKILPAVMIVAVLGMVAYIFLTPGEHHQYTSSPFVREIATLGGEVAEFVSPGVLAHQGRRRGSRWCHAFCWTPSASPRTAYPSAAAWASPTPPSGRVGGPTSRSSSTSRGRKAVDSRRHFSSGWGEARAWESFFGQASNAGGSAEYSGCALRTYCSPLYAADASSFFLGG